MMSKAIRLTLIFGALLMAVPSYLPAADMRAAMVAAREKKAELLKKTAEKEAAARGEAEESRKRITSDRSALIGAIERIKAENLAFKEESARLEEEIKTLSESEAGLRERIARMDAAARELSGYAAGFARDLDLLVSRSPQSALVPEREELLAPLLKKDPSPGMSHIRAMTDLLLEEIELSGEVRIEEGMFVDRAGKETSGEILMLGNFSSAYRTEEETGFLLYSENSRRMFALSRLPGAGTVKKLSAYMDGKADAVPMDITKGAALRQLTHRRTLAEQVRGGGPIVWPILGIFVVAVLIILERSIFLLRKRTNSDRMMSAVREQIALGNWDGAAEYCNRHRGKPLARVLSAGMVFKSMEREDMENALQEAILREIPPLERFLSTLGMLAAISPLMGLLGTVTGMINTFHVITYQGTGDPRLMSGGISEALVTTMLGLSVAIPVMVAHTILTRKVDGAVGTMEEKAVSLVNTIFKSRNGG